MLEDISLFDGLSDLEKSTVALFSQERRLPSGEILFNEGDDATAMYVVKSGRMKAYRDRSTGEQLLGYNEPGDLVGEMALFEAGAPKKRVATIRATEDTLLLVIVDYAITELSRKHPEVFAKIQKVITARIAANNSKRGGE